MNNFTFGNARHQYYETLCGGAGAGPGFDGASAVHTHMTNSRLTDPEVLEQRYPVRVRRFAIRRGSGGAGRWRGGDGVVREIEFLEPMQAAILSNRRRVAPFGLAGGAPGACGRNYVRPRATARVEELAATGRGRARSRRPLRHRDAGRRRLRRAPSRGAARRRARARPRWSGSRRGSGSRRPGTRSARAARTRCATRSRRRARRRLARRARAHEERLFGRRARQRAVLLESRQEDPHLPLESRPRPGRARSARENPARLGLDRAHDERREAARAQALPQRVEHRGAREAHVALQRRDAGLQPNERVDAHALQARGLLLADLERAARARPSASCRRAACGARRRPGRSARACRRRRRTPACRRRSGRDRRAAARAGSRSPRAGSPARTRAAPDHGRIDARPSPRRIPDEQRAPPLAVARRRDEARAAEIAPRRRRHAHEIDALAAVEREQARALGVRADDVVVGELFAVGARPA